MPTQEDVLEFARHLQEELNRRPATVIGYRDDLLRMVRTGVALAPEAVARWISFGTGDRPLSPNTRNRRLVIVRAFVRHLTQKGLLAQDPTLAVRRARPPRVARAALTEEDLRLILAQLEAEPPSWRRLRDCAILVLLFLTGLRVAELRGLNVGQVDLGARVLRAVLRKGGAVTDVPLNKEASSTLRRWLLERPAAHDDALFIGGGRKRRLTVRAIQKRLAALGKRAGLVVALHPHALRHAHATALLRGGTPTEVIRQSLNHASIATTQRYLHGDPELLRDALESLPRITSTEGDPDDES